METILLGITVVSLVVALVMGVALWRLLRDEKRRSAARVAALSVAAGAAVVPPSAIGFEPRVESVPVVEPTDTHATGFLSASADGRDDGGARQRALALASVILFFVLSGGLVWMMSGPRGTTAAAMVPDAPLELTSLRHTRQNDKLAVSGLVRNPVSGKPVERLYGRCVAVRQDRHVRGELARARRLPDTGRGRRDAVRSVAGCGADGGALPGELPDR